MQETSSTVVTGEKAASPQAARAPLLRIELLLGGIIGLLVEVVGLGGGGGNPCGGRGNLDGGLESL